MLAPKLTLNDGNQIPALGLGTSKAHGDDIIQAVKDAIDVGYRHIDCAYYYNNEKSVGIGLKAKIDDGTVKRSDLFITSKLWNTFHRPGIVEHALRKSLKNLGLDYVDLYLIHWPMAFREVDPYEEGANPELPSVGFADYDYVPTWIAMEELKKKGLAKSIGLSNFNRHQIERVLEQAEVTPAAIQLECHPFLTQNKIIDFCQSKGIQVIGYSPFASPGRFGNNPNYPKLLQDPRLKEIAKKYTKSPAQIVLRWQVQRRLVVIPKSVHKERLKENLDIFDFEISKEDIDVITAFNINFKFVHLAVGTSHPLYPFNDEY